MQQASSRLLLYLSDMEFGKGCPNIHEVLCCQFLNKQGNQLLFEGFILQNTTFIIIIISKTTAIPTQKPILIPKKDVVPNKFIQIVAQFIGNTSNP